jgi:hypothetical protein
VAVCVVGCESENVIVVNNTSSTQLRVFIKIPGGGVTTVTPTPGNASSVVVSEGGTYYAGAVLDAEWVERIRVEQQLLSNRLGDPVTRRRLSLDELREIATRIDDLNVEIRRATERPWENVGGCSGTLQLTGSGFEVEDVNAATITITDNPAGGFPAFLLICS